MPILYQPPIVSIVSPSVMVMMWSGLDVGRPIAQFPKIAPPEIQVQTTYTGADAVTVEQSVATPWNSRCPLDNMNYMYSITPTTGR